MKINSLILILLLFVKTGFSQNNTTLLWEISGKGLKNPSYVFGTMHSKDSRAHCFGDSVYAKLRQCKVSCGEINIDEVDQLAMASKMLMPKVSLSDLLSKDSAALISKILKEELGPMGALALSKAKPLFAYSALIEMKSRSDLPTTVDQRLLDSAKKWGKEVFGLETIDEAFQAMDAIPLAEQARMLYSAIESMDSTITQLDSLITLYSNQDLDGMNQYYLDNKDIMGASFDSELLVKRNNYMVERLEKRIATSSVFCAVGALHLPGKTGLLEQFKRKGYSIRPIVSHCKN